MRQRSEHTEIYNHQPHSSILPSLLKMVAGFAFLILAAEGIVRSMSFVAAEFAIPLAVIGILGVGLGNALPELYFAVTAAKRGNSKIILGELMGSVIVLTSLVLGVVAFLTPIAVDNFSPFAIARFFLIISAFFFLLFLRTGRSITKKEALFFVALYIAFVIGELFFQAPLEIQ
jgi:cation:H+ antiporter